MGNPYPSLSVRLRALSMAASTLELIKHGKEVDINHFHVSLVHALANVLKSTAKRNGIRLTGQLVSYSDCSWTEGNRAPTRHHSTGRAPKPLGLTDIDTAGPYPTSRGGSRYVVMSIDCASRLQRPYVRVKRARPPFFLSLNGSSP